MVNNKETTEQRFLRLARPEFVQTHFDISAWENLLTQDEITTLRERLPELQQLASQFVANMLKGIIKYGNEPGDYKDTDYWIRYGMDDAIDVVNYWLLLKRSI